MTPIDYTDLKRRRQLAAQLRRANTRAAVLADPTPTTPLGQDNWRADVYATRGSNTAQERRQPRIGDQKRILAIQGNVCMYCDIPIGTIIGRCVKKSHGYLWRTTVTLKRNWDHFAPYSYIVQNPGANWILSCHVCNRAKGTRMFATVADARRAILPIRDERGYESPRSVLGRLATASPSRSTNGAQKGGRSR